MLILAVLLFAGAGLVAYILLSEDPAPPPPPPERPVEPQGGGLVTAPPPPLPELPPPLPPEEPDAGEPTKVVKKGGGGGGRCNGTVDTVAVRRYAQQNSGSLRRCYERRLKQNNQLAGRLEIGLTIGSGGQVQGARIVSDSVRDADVASCVRQAVSGWRLPAPQGGCVNVTYPISFTPRAGD